MQLHVFILLFPIILISFYYDSKFNIIPNWLNVFGIFIGFSYHIFMEGFNGFLFSFFGFILGFVTTYVFYHFHSIGAGDVKWFAACGALLGMENMITILICSIFVAGFVGLILLIIRRTFKLGNMPFMYAVFPSYLLIFYMNAF